MFNYKKITAILTSAVMIGSSVGFAAAASFPSGFTSETPAIVYGTAAKTSDMTAANTISTYLAGKVPSAGGVPTGDKVLIDKDSDHMNINNTWSVYTKTIDGSVLTTLLAAGTYKAADNDEFKYEQKIILGTPTYDHFRDSDYEELAGLSSKTPVLGFKLNSNTYVMNYSIDFTSDAESDVVSAEAEDIEGSDLPLMGKTYYVSDFDVSGGIAGKLGKLTLLDSAEVGSVTEGETVKVAGHDVAIDWVDPDEVVFTVDGERAPSTGKLLKGNSYKLNDGSYIGVRDVSARDVSGTFGSASFSIGTGKLEITSGSDIKLNDVDVQGVKAWVHNGSGTSSTIKIDKIDIQWKTDQEEFLTPGLELTMPGFGAVKFTMAEGVRPEEEKITITKDSDTSIQLTVPTADGNINFNLLYTNTTGDIVGLGKATDDRLATSFNATLKFLEKSSGSDYHSYFVASYNTTTDFESYLLRAKVSYDTTAARGEVDIEKKTTAGWVEVCSEKINTSVCDIGDVSFTIEAIDYISGGNESVVISEGTNTNFYTIYSKGGLRIYLPHLDFDGIIAASDFGAINASEGTAGVLVSANGHDKYNIVNVSGGVGNDYNEFLIHMYDEDKDENIAAGVAFNVTIDDTSDNNLQVSQINGAGSGGPTSSKATAGLEQDETSVYEAYIRSPPGTRILHYTKPDEDYAEVYYPDGAKGISETYAQVYLTEGTSISSGGGMVFKDTEKTSWETKNVILVGGSCINTATATALDVAAGTCGDAWVAATGVSANRYLIQVIPDKFTAGKIALVAAGYEAADTTAAAATLTESSSEIDTTSGNTYVYEIGTGGVATKVSGP